MADTDSWTDHVLDRQAWLRFLFMLLFTPLLGCIGFMVLCLALFQFFSVLASGESNPQLRELGRDLSRIGEDIAAFLTYNTDRKPFAFKSSAHGKRGEKPAVEPRQAAETDAGTGETARESDGESAGAELHTPPGASSARRKTGARKKAATRKKGAASRKKRASRKRSTAAGGTKAPEAGTENPASAGKHGPDGFPSGRNSGDSTPADTQS